MAGLTEVRVLEIAGGVGVAWASKLLADLGADVLRVDDEGDQVTDRPFEVHRWLNSNKRSASTGVDVPRLIADADIVLHGLSPNEIRARGLDFEQLSKSSPALVVCALTPWGSVGPYAEYRGEELSVIHGSSWGFLSPAASTDPSLPPLKAPGHHATINVSTVAASVALAAHYRALTTGVGELIDFSMFAAAAKMTEWAPARALYLGQNSTRLGSKAVSPWGIYRCRDGLIHAFAAEETQWRALVELIGNPEWADLEIVATPRDRQANRDLLDMYLAEWFKDKEVADVYHTGQAMGVCVTPVYGASQLAEDDHFRERGFFHEAPDGLSLPGALTNIDQPWWNLRDTESVPGDDWRPRSRSVPASQPAHATRPLEGVRVCDFTWVWAGPFCTQLLAHLGADVIRVESFDRPDFFRRTPIHPEGVEPTLETAAVYQVFNSDKRSIAVDMRKPDARALVLDIVKQCDIVIDNFSAGTMKRFGLGEADLRAANPSVIIASLTGYGQQGPRADYIAYGPVGGAIAGQFAANGYEPGDVMEPAIAVGDPSLGVAALWSLVASLVARTGGDGPSVIDAAMTQATAATLGELWMEYQATGVDPAPRGNHDPQWTPHNCYPAAGEDRWVTIACTTDAEWQALCSVVPRLEDPRFATAAGREQHEDEIDKRITDWSGELDRWEVTRRLQSVGVPAFPSLSPIDLWLGDPQLDALGMLDEIDHPVTGSRVVPGIPWRLHHGPNGLRRPAPLIGQHTDEVMSGVLGLSTDAVAALYNEGILRKGPAPAN
ncbi:CoA transferase [Pseudonocardia sp. RS010]|uniref:CaiB/BaiF CoA-transferase family protein n=1 Tax=Pseudonocardia sp. RS010 TaxID=3385979 RepID=UPI00399F0E64